MTNYLCSETSDSSQGISSKVSSSSNQNLYDIASSAGGVGSHGGSTPSYNVTFITQDSVKLAKNTKRVYESTVCT